MLKYNILLGFPDGTVVKYLLANAGDAIDTSLILGSGRSPGEGNDKPLQYSYPENYMDRGAYSPWGELQSMGMQRVRHDWEWPHTHAHTHTHTISYSQEVQKERKKNCKKLLKIL